MINLTRVPPVFGMSTLLILFAVAPWGALAQDSTNLSNDYGSGVFADWFNRVSRIQSEQPHWITPMTTVTPRLEEELRYDQSWETTSKGVGLDNYGYGKGLELIPYDNIEVIIGMPNWEHYDRPSGMEGFADETFLFKYRIAAANEENGNYIVTGFLGLSIPTGKDDLSEHHYIVTPTLALGKGWGDFDIQSTMGVAIPDDGAAAAGTGTPLIMNTAFQYKILGKIWPEVEFNYEYWGNGEHAGLNQLFLTPGILFGRFQIWNRVGVTFGVAYQVALSERPTYNHNVILSMRIPF